MTAPQPVRDTSVARVTRRQGAPSTRHWDKKQGFPPCLRHVGIVVWPWSYEVGFPSGRTPWSWATTVGQKVSHWMQLTSDPAVFQTAWKWVTGLLLLSWLTWGLTRSEQGTCMPASWSDPTPRPDKWFSVLEKHTFLMLSLNPNSFKWVRTTSRCRTAIRSDELIGARVQSQREETDINTLCPQSTSQELHVMGKEYVSSRSLVTTSPWIWCETRVWGELSELSEWFS